MKIKTWLVPFVICGGISSSALAVSLPGFLSPARYYEPTAGRFVSADAIVQSPTDPQSLNRYAYVRNNPLNLVDPSGYSWLSRATGIHWNFNRVIHHNLGINNVNAGFFAGPGAEMNIYFTDNDAKVGGGIGVGLGAKGGVSTSDFDIFVGHGGAATIGYDPYYGPYASAWGGCTLCGGASGSATYYFNSNTYQLGGGYGAGNFGANVGYSNIDGFSVGGGYGGLGANYGLETHETRYSINMNDQDLTKAYNEAKVNRTGNGYGTGGKIFFPFDFLGTVMAGYEASDAHDDRYDTPGANKNRADLGLATDMAKGSVANLWTHQPAGLARAAIGLAIAPIYYGVVAIGGGPAYRAGQRP